MRKTKYDRQKSRVTVEFNGFFISRPDCRSVNVVFLFFILEVPCLYPYVVFLCQIIVKKNQNLIWSKGWLFCLHPEGWKNTGLREIFMLCTQEENYFSTRLGMFWSNLVLICFSQLMFILLISQF
jgi:hypothetical protein